MPGVGPTSEISPLARSTRHRPAVPAAMMLPARASPTSQAVARSAAARSRSTIRGVSNSGAVRSETGSTVQTADFPPTESNVPASSPAGSSTPPGVACVQGRTVSCTTV